MKLFVSLLVCVGGALLLTTEVPAIPHHYPGHQGNSEVTSDRGEGSTFRFQPELEPLDLTEYFKDEKLVKSHLICVVFDGPCDALGKWIKPRLPASLLGACLQCTPTQQRWLESWLENIIESMPDVYRAAVGKIIQSVGVELANEEAERMNVTFFRGNFADSIRELEALDDTQSLGGEIKNNIARAIGRPSLDGSGLDGKFENGANNASALSVLTEVSNVLAHVIKAIEVEPTEAPTSSSTTTASAVEPKLTKSTTEKLVEKSEEIPATTVTSELSESEIDDEKSEELEDESGTKSSLLKDIDTATEVDTLTIIEVTTTIPQNDESVTSKD